MYLNEASMTVILAWDASYDYFKIISPQKTLSYPVKYTIQTFKVLVIFPYLPR